MDFVHGVFYSFCRGSRALPMLSFFHICRPCGERESFQTRILGSYNKRFKPFLLSACREQQGGKEKGKKEAMGALPPNPRENIKDSNPPCCPRAANNREGRKKGKRKLWGLSPPNPRENKKIQTLPVVRVSRTTGREGKREEWELFAPKPPTGAPRPQTPSVWLTAYWTRHNLGSYDCISAGSSYQEIASSKPSANETVGVKPNPRNRPISGQRRSVPPAGTGDGSN